MPLMTQPTTNLVIPIVAFGELFQKQPMNLRFTGVRKPPAKTRAQQFLDGCRKLHGFGKPRGRSHALQDLKVQLVIGMRLGVHATSLPDSREVGTAFP